MQENWVYDRVLGFIGAFSLPSDTFQADCYGGYNYDVRVTDIKTQLFGIGRNKEEAEQDMLSKMNQAI